MSSPLSFAAALRDKHRMYRNSTQEKTGENYTEGLVLSYLGIRRAIGTLGFLLPVLLGPVGWLALGIPLQSNMSSYYHTDLRDVFVGTMCSIGVFFFCYRGHNRFEKWVANLTCASAIGIALLPIDRGLQPLEQSTWQGISHTVCGSIFFFTLALFSLWILPVGRPQVNFRNRKFQRHATYYGSGLAILGSLAMMGLHLFVLRGRARELFDQLNAVFWLEWIATWAFAAAWLVKGRTLLADS